MEPNQPEKLWREMLTDQVWQQLEEETREHLKCAGLVHSLLLRYPNRDKDWAAVGVELILAAEIEMNRKLVAPFFKWLVHEELTRVDALLSRADLKGGRGEALSILQQIRNGKAIETRLNSPMDWISRAFSNSGSEQTGNCASGDGSAEQELLELLREFFNCSVCDPMTGFLQDLNQKLSLFIRGREEILRAESVNHEKVLGLTWLTVWLFINLTKSAAT